MECVLEGEMNNKTLSPLTYHFTVVGPFTKIGKLREGTVLG